MHALVPAVLVVLAAASLVVLFDTGDDYGAIFSG